MIECEEKYHVEVSNRSAALENLDLVVDINNILEMTRDNMKKISAKESLGYYEFKKHKPWYEELLNQKKQAKLQ
jgi:hypothetical protein